MAPDERVKKRTRSATAAASKNEALPKKRKVVEEVVADSPFEDEELDDQTASLLKGFESSEDEGPGAKDFEQGQDVPAIPNDKKTRKKLDKAKAKADSSKPGVIYVG